ncbi:MAG: nucleotide exchange factor GrpE [Acidobacteriaceae bacterium]|jgi:molecular chaperone GrpE|nr:nucleotide exchange factor GrpE [Acidobacteriaceae bacterium]
MTEEDTTPPADRAPASEEKQDTLDPIALKHERDDYYDRYVRQAAEFDNYRKRVERERRARGDEAVERLMLDVLSIVDDFDRALATADDGSDSYRKGIAMIHAKFNDTLRRHGVKPIDVVGVDFDPNLHQAVAHEESATHREGQVISEMQKGYTMNDRLLRPAMVKVAKA